MAQRSIRFSTAISLVVANMVGTGVFTSLGFQLLDIRQGFAILLLWGLGGLMAFMGAMCYAELATRMPEDGGEYHFLRNTYHPAIGFMAGMVSATVGFSAPIALAAASLGTYAHGVFPQLDITMTGSVVILAIAGIHMTNMQAGTGFQRIFTLIKVLIILVFLSLGFRMGNSTGVGFAPNSMAFTEVLSAAFAVNLVYVSYAYSGWNASAYLAGEIYNPQRNLNRSILYGTGLVTLLYVALNAVFLMSAPMAEMMVATEGQDAYQPREVGLISAVHVLGDAGGRLMGGAICVLLLSTISAMVLAGPRVVQPMFARIPTMTMLARSDAQGNPVRAILFQALLALIILWTASFESILLYTGFCLSIFTMLTVAATIVQRMRHGPPAGYRAWGYPVTPVLFIIADLYIAYHLLSKHPTESLLGLGTAMLGGLLYFISSDRHPGKGSEPVDNATA
jgi:APA family basic amino acid/polyamine antiporter